MSTSKPCFTHLDRAAPAKEATEAREAKDATKAGEAGEATEAAEARPDPASLARGAPLALAALTALLALTLGALPGCPEKKDGPEPRVYPRLVATPAMREVTLARIQREPYASLIEKVEEQADLEYQEDDPEDWQSSVNGHNGAVAQANALLAWLFDDEAAAAKARDGLSRIMTHFETYTDWDINIRMVGPLLGYASAWDLLMGTPFFPAEEAEEAAAKITEITGKFFEAFVADDLVRSLLLGPAQNNHPIRTAVPIAYVALCFPEHPQAGTWRNWAFSELDYLWGETGRYVQPDGGISEGTYYGDFAWAPSVALFLGAHNLSSELPVISRDCRNRSDIDPWTGHGCVEGEEFTWQNPLEDQQSRFFLAASWALSLRTPGGARPPLEDGHLNPFNGTVLLTAFGGGGEYRWDWEVNRDYPRHTDWGCNLRLQHLLWIEDEVEATEPGFLSVVLPDAGQAVLRSDWSEEARWLLLTAEHGSARKTLHDHVDGTSFSMAAYGEYLLMDPGYYKPNPQQNARTSAAQSHSLVLIDGEAAPRKGLLTSFGDADAWLRNPAMGQVTEYVEAHQEYQETLVERGVALVDGRYFVVADHLFTEVAAPREHRWRLHAAAGYDEGGLFELVEDRVLLERPLAGMEVALLATVPVEDATPDATALALVEPPFVAEASPHVHEYDKARTVGHHGVADGLLHARAPCFLAILAPYRVGEAPGSEQGPLAVTALPRPAPGAPAASSIGAFLVETHDAVDLVLQRAEGAPETFTLPDGTAIETDARLVLVRLSGPRPYALLARGSFLTVDGARWVEGGDPQGVTLSED
ncbi:MAG: heparinase II/III family protein [Polyangia bacterium]|jgi:hypothetical protein|nr:heparinase II/III family protein [Polyangia bacterium]